MIVTLRETTSTNDYAKKLASCGVDDFTTVTAHSQTAGKGRLGRSFDSPEDEGIYMSIILYPYMKPESVSMVTLVAAVAVKRALKRVLEESSTSTEKCKLGIKWPNDIVADGRKLCGILTEASMAEGAVRYLVVGIGVNVDNTAFRDELKDKATSLRMISGEGYDKKAIVQMILSEFKSCYNQFEETESLEFMLDEYNSSLVHKGENVHIINGSEDFTGQCQGMDETGALLVRRSEDAEVTRVISGEVSVRGVYGYV